VNRLSRTVIDRTVAAAAVLYVAMCAGSVVAAADAAAQAGVRPMPVQGAGVLPRGGPLPPLPPPPPQPPKAPAVPAPPPPQSPAPQPRPSLSNLAAAALPGVAGLVAASGLGGFVGYRQAKAGFALRAAGTARFLP